MPDVNNYVEENYLKLPGILTIVRPSIFVVENKTKLRTVKYTRTY